MLVKIFALWCSTTGYLFTFDVFESGKAWLDVGLGATGNMVAALVKRLPNKGHVVTIDNFFPTVSTLCYIKEELRQNAIGTMRANRVPPTDIPVVRKNDPQGTVQEVSRKQAPHLLCSGWRDNAVVYFLSTMDKVGDRTQVRRRSGADQKVVDAPTVSKRYNEYMGGVDLNDRYRASYKTQRASKRWWLCLFYWVLDCCVINAFICYKLYHPGVTHLQFRTKLAERLVMIRAEREGRAGRPSKRRRTTGPGALPNDRFTAHVPIYHPGKEMECVSCRFRKVRTRSNIMCAACGVSYCIKKGCFAAQHSQ